MNPEMHEPEQESLDRLAEELRGAHPHPALSQNFHEVLQARMQNSWSFRAALRRNGLMRVAAGLLMISLVAAPVAAVVQLLKPPEKAPPTLGFELPEGVTEVASSEDASLLPSTIYGPEDEYDLQPDWSGKTALAPRQALRLTELLATMPRIPSQPQVLEPDTDALLRLQLACTHPDGLIPAEIAAQITLLEGIDSLSARQQTALSAWRWLQDGTQVGGAEAPAAWAGAPFLLD